MWDGKYYQGTEAEAAELNLGLSKIMGVETSYYSTSNGFYFEPLSGISQNDGNYYKNTIKSSYSYTYIEKLNGTTYLSPNFSERYQVYYSAHTPSS